MHWYFSCHLTFLYRMGRRYTKVHCHGDRYLSDLLFCQDITGKKFLRWSKIQFLQYGKSIFAPNSCFLRICGSLFQTWVVFRRQAVWYDHYYHIVYGITSSLVITSLKTTFFSTERSISYVEWTVVTRINPWVTWFLMSFTRIYMIWDCSALKSSQIWNQMCRSNSSWINKNQF